MARRRRRPAQTTDLTVPPEPPKPAGNAPRHPTFLPGVNRAPGRPAALTRDLEVKFITALRAGNTFADAARYCGMSPRTVESWIRRGRGLEEGRPATPEYVRFARLADEAKATARVLVVGNVVARSAVDTRAAEIWLKAHGGDEWRGEPADPEPRNVTTYTVEDNRDQTMVVVLGPGEIPDAVHAILDRKRREAPAEPMIIEHEERPVGPSRIRSAGLREDG